MKEIKMQLPSGVPLDLKVSYGRKRSVYNQSDDMTKLVFADPTKSADSKSAVCALFKTYTKKVNTYLAEFVKPSFSIVCN